MGEEEVGEMWDVRWYSPELSALLHVAVSLACMFCKKQKAKKEAPHCGITGNSVHYLKNVPIDVSGVDMFIYGAWLSIVVQLFGVEGLSNGCSSYRVSYRDNHITMQ